MTDYDPDHDPELDELLRDFTDDVPELERLGIFTDSTVDYGPDPAEVGRKVGELLHAREPYVDADGYTWAVTAAAVDEVGGRVAWVEWKERESGRIVDVAYHLKARDRQGMALRWEIETYNPYFGCGVRHLEWHGDAVVIVYDEKHDTYAASAARGRPVKRVLIAEEWTIAGGTLAYDSARPGEVERLALPALERLPPLPAEEARRLGLLPPGFDGRNEHRKRLQGGG